MKRTVIVAAALLVAGPALAACGTESTEQSGDSERTLSVESTDDACDVSADEAPAGVLTFNVSNAGSDVTEFYLLGEDGLRIVGEVENIGAAGNNKLTVNAPAGEYFTSCRPGMKGEGIRAGFTVTESEDGPVELAADSEAVTQAEDNYRSYVEDQSAQLLVKTGEFVDLYKAGDQDDAARELYPEAREHWERIETVAESFGDLDPRMDAREADLEPGQEWTGWHKIEKDLWPARAEKYQALTPQDRARFADDLLANTTELDRRIREELDYTIDGIANGSRGLLEEVATGKITGEEEYWSRTDLWDFQANVDGAKVAFDGVQPIVEANDAELAATLDERFDELQTLLDAQRVGEGFRLYNELSQDEIRELSNAVDALSEPLSNLSAAVLS